MDELELLKKDWNKSEGKFKVFSETDIYPMIHKRSSSIVKTLFYISIAELVFWIVINSIPYFSSAEFRTKINDMYGNGTLMLGLTIFSYAIIILFIYLLFKAHKSISVIDNAKTLMQNILKTRKVIKWYVIYNLIVAFLSFAFGLYYTLTHDPVITSKLENYNDKQLFLLLSIMIVVTAVFVLLIWLFYKLIYGILLKRLNRNYNELKKLEV